jgi:CheY-like chemotaxis protein
MTESEFRKHVKDAFEHLYDTAYLGAHPLLPELVNMPDGTRATRAQKLRGILKEAIEEIRPQQDLPATAPEWRSYNALRYRYTQGMTMAQVENTLGISQRQLQRDFHKGLDAVTGLLQEMRLTGAESERPAILPTVTEIEALRNEMNHWQLAREPTEVAALVESVQKMLQPLVGEELGKMRVELPPGLKPVLVDSTLMRQALFQILRLIFVSGGGHVVLRAKSKGPHIQLRLESNAALDETASDWQMAQLLIERQGGTLMQEDGARVAIALPRANPPRVLVIDDNRAIHELFERYLTPNFYEVVHAYNGAEAGQTALETIPDVILLDVMMPAMDGWQVLQELKQNPKTRQVPIVICSVLNEPELALSMGAHAYLKKPVERLDLLATLARLKEKEADRAAAAP